MVAVPTQAGVQRPEPGLVSLPPASPHAEPDGGAAVRPWAGPATDGSPALRAVRPVFRFVGLSAQQGLTWAFAESDLDMESAPAAGAQLAELLAGDAGPRCLLVYLGAECFVDIRGLRLLVEVTRQMRGRGGDLAVVAPPYCLRHMVSRLGFGVELALLASAEHAVQWARTRPARRPVCPGI